MAKSQAQQVIGFALILVAFVCSGCVLLSLILPVSMTVGTIYFIVSVTLGSLSPNSLEDIALQQMEGIGPVAKFLTKHRTPLLIAFVLPLSLLFDIFYYARSRYIQWSRSAPAEHKRRVEYVKEQVQAWKLSGSKKKMATARPGWMVISPKLMTYKERMQRISVELYDVLEVDVAGQTVTVEPCVSMGQLTHELLPHGLTLPVLPEMDDLTVGGLICGCGIESSSHIYGLFQAICVEFEIVVADGSVLKASATENVELFRAIPWSYGSLGFLMSAKLRVIPSKPWVRLQYHPFSNMQSCCKFFEQKSTAKEPPFFLEALVYSKDKAVVMTGTMTDEPREDGTQNGIGWWWKPWFYKHVESILALERPGGDTEQPIAVEYIPLRDYYHRHTRSIFWEAKDIIPIGNNPLFRLFFGWMMPPKVSFLKIAQTEATRLMYEKQHAIQDMLVPVETLAQSLDAFHQHYDLYPLWLCPMRVFNVEGFIRPKNSREGMYVDIGAYGVPAAARRNEFDAEAAGRAVEDYVQGQGGWQMLYADSYMSREQFREMFDHTLLDKLRKSLGAEAAFPEPFEKVGRQPPVKSVDEQRSKKDK